LRVSAPVERDVAALLALSAAVRESPSAATKDPFSGKLERLTFSSRAERERERERESRDDGLSADDGRGTASDL